MEFHRRFPGCLRTHSQGTKNHRQELIKNQNTPNITLSLLSIVLFFLLSCLSLSPLFLSLSRSLSLSLSLLSLYTSRLENSLYLCGVYVHACAWMLFISIPACRQR